MSQPTIPGLLAEVERLTLERDQWAASDALCWEQWGIWKARAQKTEAELARFSAAQQSRADYWRDMNARPPLTSQQVGEHALDALGGAA